MEFRIADDAALPDLVRPTSNCGLTRITIAPDLRKRVSTGKYQVTEMKLTSQTARSAVQEHRRLKIARVHAFAHDDARIVAEFPVELARADVDGIDARSTVLQQAIGESAGR